MTVVNGRGGKTQPLHTGHTPPTSHGTATPSPANHRPSTDRLAVSPAATAQLSGHSPFPKKFTGLALYGTGKSSGAEDSQIDKALSSFVSDFKKLSPAQQKALLADPHFQITVQGHASNLGMSTGFDNQALSEARGKNTAAYVEKFLSDHGVHVPAGKIHSTGNGNPGNPPKPVANNDQGDRSASLEIDVPAVKEPAPSHKPPAPTTHHKTPSPTPPAHKPPSSSSSTPKTPASASSHSTTAATPQPTNTAPQPVVLPTDLVTSSSSSSTTQSKSTTGSGAPFAPPVASSGGWQPPTTDSSYQAPQPFIAPTVGPGFQAPTVGD